MKSCGVSVPFQATILAGTTLQANPKRADDNLSLCKIEIYGRLFSQAREWKGLLIGRFEHLMIRGLA